MSNQDFATFKNLAPSSMPLTLAITKSHSNAENFKYIGNHSNDNLSVSHPNKLTKDDILGHFPQSSYLFVRNNKVFAENLESHSIAVKAHPEKTEISVLASLSNPLIIVHETHAASAKKDAANKNVISLKINEGVSLNLLEVCLASKEASFATHQLTKHLQKNSCLTHFFLNGLGPNNVLHYHEECVIDDAACHNTFRVNLNDGFLNSQICHELTGPKSSTNFYGVDFLKNSAQAHTVLNIKHLTKNTSSVQVFRGIYHHQSTGNFLGKVLIEKDAPLTSAFQDYKSLLLNPKAKAFCRPQMEVYNSDVSASHGATIGELDKNALFYLQSRGLSLKEAKNLLINALALEFFSKIEHKDILQFLQNAWHNNLTSSH